VKQTSVCPVIETTPISQHRWWAWPDEPDDARAGAPTEERETMEQGQGQGRKKRYDQGQIRWTERDQRLLTWLGE
jgi:hypothetical protein